jgi:hypothetical protein
MWTRDKYWDWSSSFFQSKIHKNFTENSHEKFLPINSFNILLQFHQRKKIWVAHQKTTSWNEFVCVGRPLKDLYHTCYLNREQVSISEMIPVLHKMINETYCENFNGNLAKFHHLLFTWTIVKTQENTKKFFIYKRRP